MEFLLAIILVWAVIFGLVSTAWRDKDIAVARKAYLESLSELKRAPTSVGIKQRTLTLGRAYSKLTRDKMGHLAFDETALMHDINAACVAPGAVHAPDEETLRPSIENGHRTG